MRKMLNLQVALWLATILLSHGTALAAPANDECADAIPLSLGVSMPGTTVDATDSGVAGCIPTETGDVWYRYTAALDGQLAFSICGTAFDSTLSVYDACGGVLLDCNDDLATCAPFGSRVGCLPASAGSTYFVRVAGYDAAQSGTFNLTVEEEACTPPVNDDCDSALPLLLGLPVEGSSQGATASLTPASSCSLYDPYDVWYAYQALADGMVNLATCGSGFDTSLSVFDNCGGVELGCNDDGACGCRSRIANLAVTAGITYLVRVSGYAGERGEFYLSLDDTTVPTVLAITPSISVPSNATAVNFNVRFDRSVQGFADAADLIFEESGVAHTGVAISGSGANYTVAVSGISGTGTMRLSVNTASGIESLANVPLINAFASAPVVFDTVPPDAVLSSSAGDPVPGPIPVDIAFSEVPVGFEAADLLTSNATVSGFSGTGPAYSFLLSPGSPGSFNVSLPAGAFFDTVNNPSIASNVVERTFVPVAPVPVLASAVTGAVNGPVQITVSLSQAVSGFDVEALHTVNALVSEFASNGLDYGFVLTPAVEGPFSVDIPAGGFTNLYGQLNVASNTLEWTYDATEPSFGAITALPSAAAPGEEVQITFNASEPLLENPQVTVQGNAAVPAGKATFTFTYTVQPTDPEGAATILVTGVDLAGNLGVATTTAALTILPPPATLPVPAWGAAAALALAGLYRVRRRR